MQPHSYKLAALAVVIFGCLIAPTLQQDPKEFQCYSCDSTSNANCTVNISLVLDLAKCTDATGCYTQTDGAGKVTRGCLPNGQTCEGPTCKSCKTDKCNNNKICKACDSEASADCAQTDSQAVSNAICDAGDSKCLMKVDAVKFTTVRRCATVDDLKDCNGITCKTCDTGNCNVGIFPLNRVRCFQCANCTNVTTHDDIQSQPCRLYKADDQCYMFSTDASNMQRGCVSDTADTNKCKTPASNEMCASCAADNCNSLPYKSNQHLMCVTCNGADDSNCAWGHSANSAQSCKNQIEYNKLGQCYTQTVNNVVHRGCLYDRDPATMGATCSTENNCETCSVGDGCNYKDTGVFTCIRCRSDAISDCRDNADKIGSLSCRNAVTLNTAKCFHGVWHDVVIRGCMVDADDSVQAICNDPDNKQCNVCEGKDCNTVQTSGAASLMLATGLLAAISMSLWQLR